MSPNTCSGCRVRSRVNRVLTNDRDGVRCSLATTELGPMAVLRLSAARRGGRCPVGAPTVAVGAARRLRCDARIARAAAVPLAVALNAPRLHGSSPVRPLWAGLPLALLRFSPPHKSPPPGTARRAETLVVFADACHGGAGKAAVGCAPAATLRGAEERRARGRARAARASTSDSRRLFERSERSERSEFRRGPRDRAPEGILREAEDAVHERRRTPGRGFALLGLRTGLAFRALQWLRSAMDQ